MGGYRLMFACLGVEVQSKLILWKILGNALKKWGFLNADDSFYSKILQWGKPEEISTTRRV